VATLDATTAAEYAAEVNAADRARVIVDALADPVTVNVYNASSAVVGTGEMTSPWATVSGYAVVPGTLGSFFVTTSDAPNDDWRLKFESGSRAVSLTFGVADSGAEAIWSEASFSVGTRAGISSSSITATGNRAPVWGGAPATRSYVEGVGGTYDFSQHVSDPDEDALTYSLVGTSYTGISIGATTGILTVSSSAAAAVRSLTIRATDPNGLTADQSVSVTITAQPQTTATYLINAGTFSGIRTFDGALSSGMAGQPWRTTGGVTRVPQPGDVIELGAGTHAQRMFELKNLNGTQASPIIVRGPQSGSAQAVIRRINNENGFWVSEVDRCNWLTIDGYSAGVGSATTAPYNCGIKITYSLAAVAGNPGSTTGKDGPSAWMKHIGVMRGVTIKHVHIDGGWILVDSMTTDPSGFGQGYSSEGVGVIGGDAGVARGAEVWNQQDCKYLYNYVQRTQGEGLYVGLNYFDNGAPHRNIEIAYNRIEDCGGGGIHQKCFFEGDNRCHHNIIRRAGQVSPTPSRIGITGGTGTSRIYNNWIENTAGSSTRPNSSGGRPDGISAYGLASGAPLIGVAVGDNNIPGSAFYGPYTSFPLEIYNNVIFNGGNAALYATGSANYSHGVYVGWANDAYVPHLSKVYSNTIVSNYGRGVWLEKSAAGSFIRNNIIVGNVSADIVATSNAPQAYNTTGADTSMFVSATSGNYRLTSPASYPATGTVGTDIAATDYADASRPIGATSDRGAYEG
jgi:hypothetical protein